MAGTDKFFSLISKILQQIINILFFSEEKMQVSLYLFLDLENKLTFSSAFSIYIVRGPYLTLHEVHPSAQLFSVLFCFVLFIAYTYVSYNFPLVYFLDFSYTLKGKINKIGPHPKLQQEQ